MSESAPFDPDHWRSRALEFEHQLQQVVIGMQPAIRLVTVAVFARGHVLLEGDVGVGKTTLLRSVARALGGAYERIEGTVDLMPHDLIYHTWINADGRPQVDPGPLLKHGELLSTFFFNEINPVLWGDIATSMLTLFRVMTFEDWTDVMYETMTLYPLSWTFYLSFIFFTAFAFLNMVIGIVVNVLEKENSAHERQLLIDNSEEELTQLDHIQKELAEIKAMLKAGKV